MTCRMICCRSSRGSERKLVGCLRGCLVGRRFKGSVVNVDLEAASSKLFDLQDD